MKHPGERGDGREKQITRVKWRPACGGGRDRCRGGIVASTRKLDKSPPRQIPAKTMWPAILPTMGDRADRRDARKGRVDRTRGHPASAWFCASRWPARKLRLPLSNWRRSWRGERGRNADRGLSRAGGAAWTGGLDGAVSRSLTSPINDWTRDFSRCRGKSQSAICLIAASLASGSIMPAVR